MPLATGRQRKCFERPRIIRINIFGSPGTICTADARLTALLAWRLRRTTRVFGFKGR